jgi:Uma2 family endonuclease
MTGSCKRKSDAVQIELHSQTARNLARWQELVADPELAKLPGRIETDRFGRVIMSPPPPFEHTCRASQIIRRLNELLPSGLALSETPVSTADGVKVTDAAWISAEYVEELSGDPPPALIRAPEICVEVVSPSNSEAEIAEKRALYFEAGALEVWLCEPDGQMRFYCRGELSESSVLCSGFPKQIG